VVAIQEVKSNTEALRLLLDDFLGESWGVMFSDITSHARGNSERLAFVYDRRRVFPTGLAGEIFLPPTENGDPLSLFERTPYIIGFQFGKERFALLTAHINYAEIPMDRLAEIRHLAEYIIIEIRARARTSDDDKNLILLGDFNIDYRGDNPLFQAFVSIGLVVPPQLLNLSTTLATKPAYNDQIAWFMGNVDFHSADHAGIINFTDVVYNELTPNQMSYRISDHFPVWVEFIIDHGTKQVKPL
jgi:endonuclease/exonuclease/phosphatase family metal-dependent hydrolase